MNDRENDAPRHKTSTRPRGVAIGAGIGLIFGAGFGVPGPGLVVGAALGLAGIFDSKARG